MMTRKIPAMACLLLVASAGLTGCYDDRPGRNRPHDRDHGHDRDHDRHDRGDRRPG